ncbi:MAG TPA: 2-amino-4-hydroxy-6-hydroxymethyldihydropteridine diphosphokinase [Chitinophagaceae bacterium]|jgi:2-amino-4-hydroxy-6-hydroxymethyldihydropteridine diphosphokinase|nr:2-amino-4-hydroxy-6-hydroxymethyldihydropteridine diphosphokinase [Chitinophagaceae bacterium]
MRTAYLLIGGNLGNRKENLSKAVSLINEQCGPLTGSSSIYETEAWGNTDQPSFLNQALEISTSLNARQLMRKVLKIEEEMGRVRKEKLGPRIIDIDILLFENEIHDLRFLKIPHPEMQNRRFVLVPLAEINSTLQHPVLKKSIAELLEECPDNLEVKKITE